MELALGERYTLHGLILLNISNFNFFILQFGRKKLCCKLYFNINNKMEIAEVFSKKLSEKKEAVTT